MAYISQAEAKTYLGISGTSEDDLIDALILGATETIDTYLGVTTLEEQTDASEQYEHPVSNQDGGIWNWRVFFLRGPNPTDVNTIDWTSVTINTDFILEWQRLVLKDAIAGVSTFPYKHTIVYTYGYSTIPNAVKQAMYVIVNRMRGEAKRNGDIAGFSQDKLSVTYGSGDTKHITPEVQNLLKPYKQGTIEFTGVEIDTLPNTYPKA